MFSFVSRLFSSAPTDHLLATPGHVGLPGTAHVRCALRTATLAPDVLALLRGELMVDEAELEASDVFTRNVDHPDVPEHVYFEGAYSTSDDAHTRPVRTLHPRFGSDVAKPAAPAALRRFAAAFRRRNAAWLRAALAGTPFDTLGLVPFSDAAVQHHWGAGVPPELIGWHFDAENSALHLAISISGSRALHVRAGGMGSAVQRCGPGDEVFPMSAGDTYLSQPFAFQHGVEYAECTADEDRIVAVQLRFALTAEQFKQLFRVDGAVMKTAHQQITRALQAADVQ